MHVNTTGEVVTGGTDDTRRLPMAAMHKTCPSGGQVEDERGRLTPSQHKDETTAAEDGR